METRCSIKTIVVAVMSIALIMVLSNCTALDSISSVPIKKILDNPRDYEGKVITISGEVTDVFSFFIVKAFMVRDKTGEIVVVTDRILPKKGASIKVKGKVVDAFSFGDKTITAFQEVQE